LKGLRSSYPIYKIFPQRTKNSQIAFKFSGPVGFHSPIPKPPHKSPPEHGKIRGNGVKRKWTKFGVCKNPIILYIPNREVPWNSKIRLNLYSNWRPFELWCGSILPVMNEKGVEQTALVKELKRCYQDGKARGKRGNWR